MTAGNLNFSNNSNMAGSFNLSNYQNNEYLKSLYDPTKLYAAAEARMAENELAQAESAINNFGAITLLEKFREMGFGPRVAQQIGDTAKGMVMDLIDPITDYLEKYDNIFNKEAYTEEFQFFAKQLFFANQAMSESDSQKAYGRNFVYTM